MTTTAAKRSGVVERAAAPAAGYARLGKPLTFAWSELGTNLHVATVLGAEHVEENRDLLRLATGLLRPVPASRIGRRRPVLSTQTKRMRTTFIGLLSATALLRSGTVLGQTTLRDWNIHPEGYPVTEAHNRFADEVSKTITGKYRVGICNNGALGDHPKALQIFKAGSIGLAEPARESPPNSPVQWS